MRLWHRGGHAPTCVEARVRVTLSSALAVECPLGDLAGAAPAWWCASASRGTVRGSVNFFSLSLSLPVTRMMEVETGHGGVAGTPVCVVRVREQLDRGACWNAGVRSMDASPSRLALPADLTGIIPPPCG
jgi:hypothetical protein